MRPPISVVSPVSISVTVHGSAGGAVQDHLAGGELEGHVAGAQEVVVEIVLDDVAHIAEADDEIGDAVGGVDLHDVPEDRLAADLHHRLRPERRLLHQPRAEPAGENDRLHENTSSTAPPSSVRRAAPSATGGAAPPRSRAISPVISAIFVLRS